MSRHSGPVRPVVEVPPEAEPAALEALVTLRGPLVPFVRYLADANLITVRAPLDRLEKAAEDFVTESEVPEG